MAGRRPEVVRVALEPELTLEEEVTVVATTRTGRRIEDQPMRVEALDREEIEEKMLMTPGDIVMMLNEMGGMRVQATSPSLGAASVRIQGMRGRYTRVLSAGLPLYGSQPGGLGLLQIPPMDPGRWRSSRGSRRPSTGRGRWAGSSTCCRGGPATRPSARSGGQRSPGAPRRGPNAGFRRRPRVPDTADPGKMPACPPCNASSPLLSSSS